MAKDKQSQRKSAKFGRAVTQHLFNMGARPRGYLGYDYDLGTALGSLAVTVYTSDRHGGIGWVAGRFHRGNTKLAVDKLGDRSVNRYSGNWNFHVSDKVTWEVAVELYKHQLNQAFPIDEPIIWDNPDLHLSNRGGGNVTVPAYLRELA